VSGKGYALALCALAALAALLSGCRRVGRGFTEEHEVPQPTPRAELNFRGRAGQVADAGIWDGLLKDYVRDGLVDYEAIRRDPRLWRYLRQLGATNPKAIASPQERLALLLNAYNCFVVEGVVKRWPLRSVRDFPEFFSEKSHKLGGIYISLDEVEQLIRALGEPRVHCALVRGSRGDPTLRQEAYVSAALDAQLESDCLEVINNPRWVRVDRERRTVYLADFFREFLEDLRSRAEFPEEELLDFIYDRLNSPRERDVLALEDRHIEFLPHDWRINAGRFARRPTATPAPEGERAARERKEGAGAR